MVVYELDGRLKLTPKLPVESLRKFNEELMEKRLIVRNDRLEKVSRRNFQNINYILDRDLIDDDLEYDDVFELLRFIFSNCVENNFIEHFHFTELRQHPETIARGLSFLFEEILSEKYNLKGQLFIYGDDPKDIHFLSFVNGTFVLFKACLGNDNMNASLIRPKDKEDRKKQHEYHKFKFFNSRCIETIERDNKISRTSSLPQILPKDSTKSHSFFKLK